MLAVSVKQPWAELIAAGSKAKEFRTWKHGRFGDLLIVASKGADPDEIEAEGLNPSDLVFGQAVCVVEFFKVTGSDGDYDWHLRNPRRVDPFPQRGSASLYHVDDAKIRYVGAAGSPAPHRTDAPEPGATEQHAPVEGAPKRGSEMSKQESVTWEPNQTVKVEHHEESFKPYDHQLAAWDKLTRYFSHDRKQAGMLVVPTGGGKTEIAARWLLREHVAKGGRVLWFAHRRGLLRQALRTFAGAAHLAQPKSQLKLITISSTDCKWSAVSKEHDVVFSSVQSATLEGNFGFLDLMAKQSPNGLMIVVDEAHHAASPSYQRVLKELQRVSAPILGLSATPVRMDADDHKRLWNLFTGIVYEIDKTTLFNKEILAIPRLETVNTKIEFERDFTEEDAAHLAKFGELGPQVLNRVAKHAGRNRLIVEEYLKKKEIYGQTIVFAADSLHAQTLAAEFTKHGVDADYVDYSRTDSHAVMASYRDNASPKVLANVEMLTEGFDAPKTKTVFIVRPTRSEALLSQMIGRALRGPLAGGNKEAHLVTFVDTWQQFSVLDTAFLVQTGQVEEPPIGTRPPPHIVRISAELIREAYRLVQSNVRGTFVGVHQCLPQGWYIWEEDFDNDVQQRLVLVYENQVAGFAALDAAFSDPAKIPAEVTEDLARDLVRRYFGDCPDPLPRWADVQSMLNGRRKGSTLVSYTFEEKKAFDPSALARSFHERNVGEQTQITELRSIWDASPACSLVYLSDFKSFVEDVKRELGNIIGGQSLKPKPSPKFVESIPKGRARRFPEGEAGYSLTDLVDAVLAQPKHFPEGAPIIKELRWAQKVTATEWGFFQFDNKAVVINPELNSPDVPRYAMEFLLYHELLHALMPSAGHNRDYRARERLFTPSAQAVADAEGRGHTPGTAKDAWRVLAEQFFDTFQEYFSLRPAGAGVTM